MHCLTPEQAVDEVTAAGFRSPARYGDVTGAVLDPNTATFAVGATR